MIKSVASRVTADEPPIKAAMASEENRSGAASVDLLSIPVFGEGVSRRGNAFAADRPWAIADFGDHTLKQGWWRFDCEGELEHVEVRLRSAHDPLIVLPADGAGSRRVFLRSNQPYRISLLVSPWPGQRTFVSLRLMRLNSLEVTSLAVESMKRLLKNRNRLEVVGRVLRRLSTGHAVGIGAGVSAQPKQDAAIASMISTCAPIKNVIERGGIKAVLADGDSLHPDAFDIVTSEFSRLPDVRAIICDVREAGRILPRPQWDGVLAEWVDLIAPPIFFRDSPDETLDLTLSAASFLAENPRAIHRLPLPLASRPQIHRAAAIAPPRPSLVRKPLVSIIIPTKTRTHLLAKCLHGLAHKTDYPNLDIVIVDNGADTHQLESLLSSMRSKVQIRDIKWPHEFNFPEINAAGVKEAKGEIILLLNDDVEPLEPGWLDRMVASAIEPDVGPVGARLLYPDRSIQHAGVMIGLGGACGHLWKGTSEEEARYNPYIAYPGSRLAVTGACLAVRRDLFDLVGGLDAEYFPVSFNDIDFCLRLGKHGYRTVYRGDAVLLHHESQSRGLDSEDPARSRRLAQETQRFLERWGDILDDPFGSPAFDPTSESGAIHPALRADYVRR